MIYKVKVFLNFEKLEIVKREASVDKRKKENGKKR